MSSTVELSLLYDVNVYHTVEEPSLYDLLLKTVSKSTNRMKLFKDHWKVVFLEYMNDDIPPFLRRVFPDKAKNLENKASLGKAAQGKAAKGKAAKGKDAQEDKKVVNNSFLRLVEDLAAWDDFSWGEYYWEEFYKKAVNLIDNHKDTHINFKKKNPSKLPTFGYWMFPNSYHWWSKESEVIPRCLVWTRIEKGFEKQNYPQLFGPVDDRNGFTRDDEPEAEQDESGASDRASAGAKVEETKSTREVALEEELDLWKSRYATSVCDDINEADAAVNDNAKATSAHDDVGVPDAAADDNAKATSVCDDIDEADAAADDNAKATSVHDDVGVPDAAADDNAKVCSERKGWLYLRGIRSEFQKERRQDNFVVPLVADLDAKKSTTLVKYLQSRNLEVLES
ncbi:hypothetical protein Tco_1033564 [Tanacetum coccineum]